MCQFKVTTRVNHPEVPEYHSREFSLILDIPECFMWQLDLANLKDQIEKVFIRRIQKDIDKRLWRFQTTSDVSRSEAIA